MVVTIFLRGSQATRKTGIARYVQLVPGYEYQPRRVFHREDGSKWLIFEGSL